MIQKLLLLSGLIISTTCTIVYQVPVPTFLQYRDDPNYSFAYEVNDEHTGDIKNQQESRRGDTVIGQYSLIQPDGIRRIVDYKADDLRGFRAVVNNEGVLNNQNVNGQGDNARNEMARDASIEHAMSPISTESNQNGPNASPAPVAISRTSIFQSLTKSHPVIRVRNPWN